VTDGRTMEILAKTLEAQVLLPAFLASLNDVNANFIFNVALLCYLSSEN
jgi:hypothetical protein